MTAAPFHGRLRCARCRKWRGLAYFAAGEGPHFRDGRAWCCRLCAPYAERDRDRRAVSGQAELPLAPTHDPAAEVFD